MHNQAMKRKLDSGEAIDVSGFPFETGRAGTQTHYTLPEFVEDKDYCDAKTESWIWSIGRRESDGVIFASTGVCFYQEAGFECLFVR